MSDKTKDISLLEIKKIASRAISEYNLDIHLDDFTSDEIERLCATADPDVFTDNSLIGNDVVRANIPWARVEHRRACRLMARLIDREHYHILDLIKTMDMKVRIRDIKSLLIRDPSMIERFNIDMVALSNSDAHALLELGKDYFFDRVTIKGRNFNSTQQYSICKAYGYQRKVLLLFNPSRFDGFHTCEILKKTMRENLDLLDLNVMKLIDWLNLLEEVPDMYDQCDPLRYRSEPILHLINLAAMFDDDRVYGIILQRDLADVSPFGWEKLLSHRPDQFESLCDINKLDAMNIRNIVREQPHLEDRLSGSGSSPASYCEGP